MIEIHSLTAVLGLEVLLLLLAVLVFVLWRRSRNHQRDRASAGELVQRVNAQMDERLAQLNGQLFGGIEGLPEDARRESVNAVAMKENELYRHVIRAFLDRDALKLAELDHYVHGVSEPYCRLIGDLISHLKEQPKLPSAEVLAWERKMAAAQAEAVESQARAERINHQLSLALDTLDEVSSEYTKMFGETAAAEELQASRKRMLEVFGRTERRMLDELLPELPPDSLEQS
ncbi:MAG: hypothetical protein FIA97_13010 [Methylococcaceae bacterium]|nr:hypothetical protein [Methylococcaceae bacterium]